VTIAGFGIAWYNNFTFAECNYILCCGHEITSLFGLQCDRL